MTLMKTTREYGWKRGAILESFCRQEGDNEMMFNIIVLSIVIFYAGYRFGQHVIIKGLTYQINDMLNDYDPEKRLLIRKALKAHDKK